MGTGKNLSRSLDLGFMEARKLGTEGSGCLLVGFFFSGFFLGGDYLRAYIHIQIHTHIPIHTCTHAHTRACIHVLWYAHGSQKTTNPS